MEKSILCQCGTWLRVSIEPHGGKYGKCPLCGLSIHCRMNGNGRCWTTFPQSIPDSKNVFIFPINSRPTETTMQNL